MASVEQDGYLNPMATFTAAQMQQMVALNMNGLVATPLGASLHQLCVPNIPSPTGVKGSPAFPQQAIGQPAVEAVFYQRHPPLSTEPHRHRPPAAGLRWSQKYARPATHCADYGQVRQVFLSSVNSSDPPATERRLCELQQPGQHADHQPGHEQLPDEHEEAQSAAQAAQRDQSPILSVSGSLSSTWGRPGLAQGRMLNRLH
ncbi:hypothetical protein GH733_000582 [Mirounga leonina]|nr:hypothetical protein GH733_000582 [Mirounga leonina]